MREYREHPVAHFLLKPVHHRQHNDERRYAKRNAKCRDRRDERDEAVALRGIRAALASTRIAQSNLPFKGEIHGNQNAGDERVARGPARRSSASVPQND